MLPLEVNEEHFVKANQQQPDRGHNSPEGEVFRDEKLMDRRGDGGRLRAELRKFEQDDKWIFCLTAGTLCPANSGETISRRPRRNHAPGFKAKVTLAAIKGDRTLAQLAEQFDVHPNQITSWKAHLEEGAAECSVRASATAARSRPST